jgi:hypothetical protein
MMIERILTYDQKSPGRLECRVDLSALYPSKSEFAEFKKRYHEFRKCDKSTQAVYKLKGNKLLYQSEQLIPTKRDGRHPLLLIFGNPASHSVQSGMFFAFRGGKENPFWKALLCRAGVLDFGPESRIEDEEANRRRSKRMMALDYRSPLRIGLCVYISMPSAAGGPWSGVAGIRKLFGAQPLKRLEALETERILEVAKRFLTNGGSAVTFQRNAWEGLRSEDDPRYSIGKAREASLRGSLEGLPKIPLIGVPPTRLIGPARDVLRRVLSEQGYKLLSESDQLSSRKGWKKTS